MSGNVESFFKGIFRDLQVDSHEEDKLNEYFDSLNPPPDTLVSLRATAFRLGCDYLSDDQERNEALLKTINAIVHSMEKTCMVPKDADGNSEYDDDKAEAFFKKLYSDLSVDQDENEDLFTFFKRNIPPAGSLVALRATAFKVACSFLADDNETNISLLRCVNVVVHAFENTCLVPKDYQLKLAPEFDLDVNLSDAIQQMWNLDMNRLKPGTDYVLNVQEGKKPYEQEDTAHEPLFTSVSSQALSRPTYKLFYALLDNYTAKTGSKESISSQEKSDVTAFLKAIMQTAPMQLCHKYLLAKGADDVPSDPSDFIQLLYTIWFELYSRDSSDDSSGFEHVFVGEVKDDKISGFHNWIHFYLEEKKGNVDYRGYVHPRTTGGAETNSDDHVLTLQFRWHGVEKFVGTSFIGVSPEFEFAVYTTCFLLGSEDNDVVLNTGTDEFHLNIKCYKIAGNKIGTAFPEANEHYD